jgi:hypothetical protein
VAGELSGAVSVTKPPLQGFPGVNADFWSGRRAWQDPALQWKQGMSPRSISGMGHGYVAEIE